MRASSTAVLAAAAAAALLAYAHRRRRKREAALADDDAFFERAPKVELHVHLDGAFDGEFLFECARRHVEALPTSVNAGGGAPTDLCAAVRAAACSHEFLSRHVHLPAACCSLVDFLAPFSLAGAILKTTLRAEGLGPLEELAFRFARRQHESNVVYTEVRYSPHLFLQHEELVGGERQYLAAEAAVRAVSAGLARGEAAFGLVLRQILCCIDFAPQWSADCARLLRTVGPRLGLVGIDVAAGEGHFERRDAAVLAAVRDAKAAGYGVTLHAGEDPNAGGTPANVVRAVEEYGATRIGHGYAIVAPGGEAEAARELVRRRRVHVEACPTSSSLTGGFGPKTRSWREHPLARYCALGLSCSCSTDDPLYEAITLADEWRRCEADIGLSRAQMRAMSEHALDAAFCTEDERAALRLRVAEWHAKCRVCSRA